MTNKQKAEEWLKSGLVPEELKEDIKKATPEQIEDMFYRELEFGTGGMRGILGPGSNRMNVLTIKKATLGFGLFLLKEFGQKAKTMGVVISHDNRINSRVFTLTASGVLNDLGINTYIFDSLRPTPELSFTVRYTKACGGIMITASHNPKEYNGYKVYDETGCQLVPDKIQPYLDIMADLGDELELSYKRAEVPGRQITLDSAIDDAFLAKVHSVAINKDDKHVIKIVFTPQHGTSSVLGRRLFKELGYVNDIDFFPVLDQCTPDPYFSCTESPNPEMKEAYIEALEIAKQKDADLILTTDPDADRVGIGFKDSDGRYQLYNGNQTGALLIDYVLSNRERLGLLTDKSTVCDTIVTSTLGEKIARNYHCSVRSFLTGFKYIGEAINKAEKTGEFKFEFGYEESYGYIVDTFCRDKDSLESLLMIAEMVNHYALKGITLDQKLDELYKKYGYHITRLFNIYFPGEEGLHDMKKIMGEIRADPFKEIGGIRVVAFEDYLKQEKHADGKTFPLKGFPLSDVFRFFLEDGSWLAIRPSGTEPKCKFYYEAVDKEKDKAINKPDLFHKDILSKLNIK